MDRCSNLLAGVRVALRNLMAVFSKDLLLSINLWVSVFCAIVWSMSMDYFDLLRHLKYTTANDPLFYIFALLQFGFAMAVVYYLLYFVGWIFSAVTSQMLSVDATADELPELQGLLDKFFDALRRNRAEVIMLVVCVGAAWVFTTIFVAHPACTLPLGAEAPWDEEEARRSLQFMSEFAHQFRNLHPQRPALRVQHAGAMGCVRASLTVEHAHPAVAYGLFAPEQAGREYKAWVRFSHGDKGLVSDRAFGARGMAIKVLNVTLPRTIELKEEPTSHDILLLSAPVFFASAPDEYAGFVEHFVSNTLHWWFLQRITSRHAWRTLVAVAKIFIMSSHMRNLVDWTYYSTTPYRLGDSGRAAKYILKPCLDSRARNATLPVCSDNDKHCLREILASVLEKNNACFELHVQLQEHACREPVEDPTVEWKTATQRVATLRIPSQQFSFASQHRFCESMSFTVWHAPDAHRPLGAVNHHRLAAYTAMAGLRNQWNAANSSINYTVITGDETFSGQSISEWEARTEANWTAEHPLGDVEHFQFRPYNLKQYKGIPEHHLYVDDYMPAKAHALTTKDLKFSSEKTSRILRSGLMGINNGVSEVLVQHHARMKHPNDYVQLLSDANLRARVPWVARDRLWERDEVFAAQFLRGVHPMAIRRIKPGAALPAAFDLTEADIAYIEREVLNGNETFEHLRMQGRLLYADYAELAEVPIRPENVCYPALVLFYVERRNTRGDLLPLAIQLNQTEAKNDAVFLPPQRSVRALPAAERDLDTRWMTWIFARMHVASSDAQVHEMVSHLGTTHLLLEPIFIATYRQFPRSHPVFKLLKPHMRQTVAINELGRRTLLNVDGFFDRLTAGGREGTLVFIARACMHIVNFTERAFPLELRSRGFDRVPVPGGIDDPVPGYLYRDYGFMVWDALWEYVTTVIDSAYPNDSTVAADAALQRWGVEVADPSRGNLRGFPRGHLSKNALVWSLTNIIFTASAQHSAVNFGQFDFYGFVPNKPMRLTLGMPSEPHTHMSWDHIMKALPDASTTIDQITITNVLSMKPALVLDLSAYNQSNVYIAQQLTEKLELDDAMWRPEFVGPWQRLMTCLREAQAEMKARNELNGYKYEYMYYDEIAMSVAI